MHGQSRSDGGAPSKKKPMRSQKGTQTTAPSKDQDLHDSTVARDPASPPRKKQKQNQRDNRTAAPDTGLDDEKPANTKQMAPRTSAKTSGEQAQPEEPKGLDQPGDPEVETRMYCNVCLHTVEKLGEAVSISALRFQNC